MKTKRLTIDILAINSSIVLENGGLAQKLFVSNFETLKDFQDFLSAVPNPLTPEGFDEKRVILLGQIDAMYAALRSTSDSDTLADYNKSTADALSSIKMKLKEFRDSLGNFTTFRAKYEAYCNEAIRQTMDDFRIQKQLDDFVVTVGSNGYRLGAYITYDEIKLMNSEDRFNHIKRVLMNIPFSMKESDVGFVLMFVNQQNFIANTMIPFSFFESMRGGTFINGKSRLRENQHIRSINLYVQEGALEKIVSVIGQKVVNVQGKPQGIDVDFIEEMKLTNGKISERSASITSAKAFTVPAELSIYSAFVQEIGVFTRIKKIIAVALTGLRAKIARLRHNKGKNQGQVVLKASIYDKSLMGVPLMQANQPQNSETKNPLTSSAEPRFGYRAKEHERINKFKGSARLRP